MPAPKHHQKDLLRILACGSVDDGKSTLIGRLFLDTGNVEADTLAALERDSVENEIDPALLTDGLMAEREQGITIDVAHRYFSTDKRSFIVADSPGHVQYTRNMVSAASRSDIAIVLIDAANGLTEQTRRHSFLASLLGIKHLILAVNKMDTVGYSQKVFERIAGEFSNFSSRLEIADIHFIPLAALPGDNVVQASQQMPWYNGSTLLHLLETVHVASDANLIDVRFPVQYVQRLEKGGRQYSGTVASGIVRTGQEVLILPSQTRSTIAAIHTYDATIPEAVADQAVQIALAHDVDTSRGDMFVAPGNVPTIGTNLQAMLVCMDEEHIAAGLTYTLKHASREVVCTLQDIQYRMNMQSLHREQTDGLHLNDIRRCTIECAEPIFYDPYSRNRTTGSFILIDRRTGNTVAAGILLGRSVDTSQTLPKEDAEKLRSSISPEERAAKLGHKAALIVIEGEDETVCLEKAYKLERELYDTGIAAVAVLQTAHNAQITEELLGAGMVCIVLNTETIQQCVNKGAEQDYVCINIDASTNNNNNEILHRICCE